MSDDLTERLADVANQINESQESTAEQNRIDQAFDLLVEIEKQDGVVLYHSGRGNAMNTLEEAGYSPADIRQEVANLMQENSLLSQLSPQALQDIERIKSEPFKDTQEANNQEASLQDLLETLTPRNGASFSR